jgi:hypothetical protein
MLSVSEAKLASAVLMQPTLPEVADFCKRCVIQIGGAETDMTTNTRFTSNASTLNGQFYFQTIGSQKWPDEAIDVANYPHTMYEYALSAFSGSNPVYFKPDGITYTKYFTATDSGWIAFCFSEPDNVAEEALSEYSLTGIKITNSSLVHIQQSAVTVAGYTRIFLQCVSQYTLGGSEQPKTSYLRQM